MTNDFFQYLLPEIDRYYDRHRPSYTRAQWHDAWLKADGFGLETGQGECTIWFVREYGDEKRTHVRILAFNVRDELLSSEELYRKTESYGMYDEQLEDLLNER